MPSFRRIKVKMSKYPFEYEELDEETNNQIKRDFKAYRDGLIRCKPSNFMMVREFIEYGEKFYNMEIRKDDVWVVTYPKTGTTWTQAAVWAVMNDANFEKLTDEIHMADWYFIEMGLVMKQGFKHIRDLKVTSEETLSKMQSGMGTIFERALTAPSPRYIKTHLPLCHLPPNLLDTAKVIYVVRNPKDTMVSFYYHNRDILGHDFNGEFSDFFEYAKKDLLLFDPYWPHVLEAYEKKNHPNMLFLYYEDMKKDFKAAIRKLADFLGKSLTDEQVDRIEFELRIENMKKNPQLSMQSTLSSGVMKKGGQFIRKGVVGDWKHHFTPKMLEEFEEWSRKGRKGTNIKFPGE